MYHFNRCMTQRFQRDIPIPPFWRMDDCHNCVRFRKEVDISAETVAKVWADGLLNISFDAKLDYYEPVHGGELVLKAGKYTVTATVYANGRLPAFRMESAELVTDGSWRATCNDGDEAPAAVHDLPEDIFPSDYRLPVRQAAPEKTVRFGGKLLYDFGRELVGFVRLEELSGTGCEVYYGESKEEAADGENCEQLDRIPRGASEWLAPVSKAFRYISLSEGTAGKVSAMEEYADIAPRAHFQCADAVMDRIFDTSVYTLRLNTREFFLDGVKRDRWVWAGDATQSYRMNYYAFGETETVRRTMLALLGRRPYNMHINHIMDYTFFWLISLGDYVRYTGDEHFVRAIYGQAAGLMDFCIGRANKDGLMEGYPEDWVFIDWADGIDNRGEVTAEQMLYAAALAEMAALAQRFGNAGDAERYRDLAGQIRIKLEEFWDQERQCYVYGRRNGQPNGIFTKHPNLFAVLFGFANGEKREHIRRFLSDPEVPEITTPYMRFYELSALCELGEYERVYRAIREYWGGMLGEGATTFWEQYDPRQTGPEKYAMYGRKFGKSLCHAWGASPLYLIARYFVGLTPLTDGYGMYRLEPHLEGIGNFKAVFPLGEGSLRICADEHKITVFSDRDGQLIVGPDTETDRESEVREGRRVIFLPKGTEHTIRWGKRG